VAVFALDDLQGAALKLDRLPPSHARVEDLRELVLLDLAAVERPTVMLVLAVVPVGGVYSVQPANRELVSDRREFSHATRSAGGVGGREAPLRKPRRSEHAARSQRARLPRPTGRSRSSGSSRLIGLPKGRLRRRSDQIAASLDRERRSRVSESDEVPLQTTTQAPSRRESSMNGSIPTLTAQRPTEHIRKSPVCRVSAKPSDGLEPRLGRGGGRGGRWAAWKREREGERDGCEFGRLGDERDRLDPFRRSGESGHPHGHEQRPRCDLAEAEEPGEESDTWIVWTCDERARHYAADRRGGDECIPEGRHLLQVFGCERGVNAGAEGDKEREQPGQSGRAGCAVGSFGRGYAASAKGARRAMWSEGCAHVRWAGRVARGDPGRQVGWPRLGVGRVASG